MQADYMENDFDPQKLSFDNIEEEKEFCSKLGETFSFMPGGNGTAPKWLLKSNLENEVVFYPGTFNPWHLGHRACLDLCPSKSIIVVPDFNPWKEGAERGRPWEQLKALLYSLSETNYSIYPGFLSKEEGNPTVSWFPKVNLKKKSLLMGDDSFLSLHKWKDIDELAMHITTLYIAPRGAEGSALEEQVKRFPQLKIVFLDHHDFEDVSSTNLRNK